MVSHITEVHLDTDSLRLKVIWTSYDRTKLVLYLWCTFIILNATKLTGRLTHCLHQHTQWNRWAYKPGYTGTHWQTSRLKTQHHTGNAGTRHLLQDISGIQFQLSHYIFNLHVPMLDKIHCTCFILSFTLLLVFIIYYIDGYTNNVMLKSLTLNCLFQTLITVTQTLVTMVSVWMEWTVLFASALWATRAYTVKQVGLTLG